MGDIYSSKRGYKVWRALVLSAVISLLAIYKVSAEEQLIPISGVSGCSSGNTAIIYDGAINSSYTCTTYTHNHTLEILLPAGWKVTGIKSRGLSFQFGWTLTVSYKIIVYDGEYEKLAERAGIDGGGLSYAMPELKARVIRLETNGAIHGSSKVVIYEIEVYGIPDDGSGGSSGGGDIDTSVIESKLDILIDLKTQLKEYIENDISAKLDDIQRITMMIAIGIGWAGGAVTCWLAFYAMLERGGFW